MFLIQVRAHYFTGVQVAIRETLEEAIALRESLVSAGYYSVTVIEVGEDGRLIYHVPEIKYGDPLGLLEELQP